MRTHRQSNLAPPLWGFYLKLQLKVLVVCLLWKFWQMPKCHLDKQSGIVTVCNEIAQKQKPENTGSENTT
jgi:hypothetical protein